MQVHCKGACLPSRKAAIKLRCSSHSHIYFFPLNLSRLTRKAKEAHSSSSSSSSSSCRVCNEATRERVGKKSSAEMESVEEVVIALFET
ncbi:hypothetical protein E2C01_070082 [Portunus trituberculatus]|uniref:Uncharacterized protein n=1 Tax=Portunus trituberculatus TaxID=210409 RepID=A0A5B7I1B5_PORTR|nr:hypothetical protein [Portunus trituberculatus]